MQKAPIEPLLRSAQKSELPRWLQIVVFTTILLALTLLAMWGSRPRAL